jgi:hypothetical protein
MNTLTPTIHEMLLTLENLELLALNGHFNPLAAMTARLLALEITNSETSADALERAAQFVEQCRAEARVK